MLRADLKRLCGGAVILAGLALAGCSQSPTAPVAAGIKNPEFVRSTKAPTPGLSSMGDVVSLTESQSIDGAVGGLVSVGRFTLLIPAGAFQGVAQVSISVPDSGVVQCDLSIDPPSANHFAVPVTLRSHCSGTSAVVPNRLLQLWFDEQRGLWVPVPGATSDMATFDVVAPLMHFSAYGIVGGKAGW